MKFICECGRYNYFPDDNVLVICKVCQSSMKKEGVKKDGDSRTII